MNKKNISKRFIAVFLVFMMSFFMISCGNKEKKKLTAQNEDNKTKETTEEIKEQNKDITEELTTEDTTPKVDYEAIYEPVLKENYDALVNGYDYEKDYKYLSSGVMEALTYENDNNMLLDEMGYIIEDISGDGIPELMIGRNNPTSADNMADEEGYIYSGYTYKDGELVCFLEGWIRSRHQMIGDNDFYYSGSSGAMNSVFGQYR